jgi:hypothetical protein
MVRCRIFPRTAHLTIKHTTLFVYSVCPLVSLSSGGISVNYCGTSPLIVFLLRQRLIDFNILNAATQPDWFSFFHRSLMHAAGQYKTSLPRFLRKPQSIIAGCRVIRFQFFPLTQYFWNSLPAADNTPIIIWAAVCFNYLWSGIKEINACWENKAASVFYYFAFCRWLYRWLWYKNREEFRGREALNGPRRLPVHFCAQLMQFLWINNRDNARGACAQLYISARRDVCLVAKEAHLQVHTLSRRV